MAGRPAHPAGAWRDRGRNSLRTYRCFGITVASPLAFPGEWPPCPVADDPTLLVDGRLGSWRGAGEGGWSGVCDGERFAAERASNGAYRFFHGGRTLLELSPDHRRLTGDLDPAVTDVRWWRAVLDSILFTVALLRGGEALHAGAVATPAGAVAIAGPQASGKSTLLAHLVRHEDATLLCDDVLFVSATGPAVVAHPGPPLMTVPRTLPGTGSPPGTPIDDLADETWTAVATGVEPVALRRIVLLDRSAPRAADVLPEPEPFVALMRHLLPFPRTGPRAAARLALASEIARTVELVRLRAPLHYPVQGLAERALGSTLQART